MSKEFEELVLKKLEILDSFKGRFDNLEERFDNLENRFDKQEDAIFTVNAKVDNLSNKFDMQQKEINLLNKKVNDLSANLARHEEESNKKIGALFDLFEVNKDFNNSQKEKNSSFETEIFNRDIRITKLEQKLSS